MLSRAGYIMKFLLSLFFLFTLNIVLGQSCVVNKIKFEGTKKTNTIFLQSLLEIKKGELLNENLIQQDLTRLIRLPSIANATHKIDSTNNGCDLIIKIVENKTTIPVVNLFDTSDREIAFLVGLYEHDLFKRAISFGGWYQKNIFDSYGVGLRAPYLFSSNFGLEANAQNLSTQEPVFFDNGIATYKYTNQSVEVLGLYQFNFKNRVSIGVNVFKETYEGISIDNIPEAPSDYSLNKILFKSVYTFDNLKYNYQYVSGFKSELNVQYVLSSDEFSNKFAIAWNDFLYFKRLGKKGNFAQRLRFGLSTNDESPFAPFSVDNNLNIRGVGNIIDRGTGVIISNSEFRYTMFENEWGILQSNVFIDAGTWRNPGGDFTDFSDNNNVRVFPGVGVRFIHKKIFNLVLRADFGYGITEDEPRGFVFGVGQYF